MRRLLGMKVTTIRWSDNGARGRWPVASSRGGLRFARLGSQPAPQFGREQLTPKLVEIGQGKHSGLYHLNREYDYVDEQHD